MCANAFILFLISRLSKGRTRACRDLSSVSIHSVDLEEKDRNNNVPASDIFTSGFMHARWRIAGVPFDSMSRADSEQGTVVTLKGGSSDY